MSPTLERRMERRDERGDYHAEPSKAIRAQWHSNMFLLSCLCQGVRVYMCEGVYV